MKDCCQREIDYLRLSVTDRCNLRCRYCVPPEGRQTEGELLSDDELVDIVTAAASLGVRKLRITGGEPLVREGIVGLCSRLHQVEGIAELTLTTNGQQLEALALPLREAGVARVNLSLDTLRPERYRAITRGGSLERTLRGITAAQAAGFPLKLNVVLIGGFNEDEIKDFVALTQDQPLEVRFIELMPMGPGADVPPEAFLSCEEVLRRVPLLQSMGCVDGVARLYRLPDGVGRVGLISPVSRDFCGQCNRLRVTARGTLKPCLHTAQELPLRGLAMEALQKQLRRAMAEKPARHPDFVPGQASAGGRMMYSIGG